MTSPSHLRPVLSEDLPVYPFGRGDRLDSHWFIPWERRRWLASDMGLRGTLAAKSLYFDLICHSYDQSPIGTLPTDRSTLAKLVRCDRDEFENLCRLEYGPLHRWTECLCDEGEVRLMHSTVVATLQDGFVRREDNRARNEAATRSKRLLRLRGTLGGISADLHKNDYAVNWIAEWLEAEGIQKWGAVQVERAVRAFIEHRRAQGDHGMRR